jgi:lysozyme
VNGCSGPRRRAKFSRALLTGAARQINAAGLALIKRWEGLRLEAYPDPKTGADPWTIGYGHTGPSVKPGARITEHQAEAILAVDLDRFEEAVEKRCPGLNDNEFAACVSLAFNIGATAFAQRSQVARWIDKGDKLAAALAFRNWTAGGMRGLIARRAAESTLFLTPVK